MLQPNFNPRSHEGSDDYSLVFAGDYGISIRAPTRGATCNPRNNGILVDFNPRSHEGSDFILSANRVAFLISIRAPTRGATVCHVPCQQVLFISIRAPTRGATASERVLLFFMLHFNPRSHEGSDAFVVPQDAQSIISIRAPTRGATRMLLWMLTLW